MSITYGIPNGISAITLRGNQLAGGYASLYTASGSVPIRQGAPLNGYYIDHVRLYVLQQVLALQSELMNDLMENRNAKHQQETGCIHGRNCPWDEAEGR